MIIFRDKPYAFVLLDERVGSICSFCLKELPARPLVCINCQYPSYCSKECQDSDRVNHNLQCPYLAAAAPNYPEKEVIIFSQVLLKSRQESEMSTDSKVSRDKLIWVAPGKGDPVSRSLADLMTHADQLDSQPEKRANCEKIIARVKRYLAPKELSGRQLIEGGGNSIQNSWVFEFPSDASLVEIYCKLNVNSLAVLDHNRNYVGIAFYLNYSALNHSCVPNCSYTFEGQTVVVYSLANDPGIKWALPQDMMTITYVSPLMNPGERKTSLESGNFFSCNCALCSNSEQNCAMESVFCQTCHSGLAYPNQSSLDLLDNKVDSYKKEGNEKSTEIIYKCRNQNCNAEFPSSCYSTQLADAEALLGKLAKIPNISCKTVNDTKIAPIIKDFDEAVDNLLPPQNTLRARIANKLENKFKDNDTFDALEPVAKYGQIEIETAKLYYGSGNASLVRMMAVLAENLLKTALVAIKAGSVPREKIIKYIHDGESLAKDALSSIKQVYGDNNPMYPSLINTLADLTKLKKSKAGKPADAPNKKHKKNKKR